MLELHVHGAAGEVTGSCHLLKVGKRQVLLDCGLIQGSRKDETRNQEPFPFDPAGLDAVILSHAHIDHSGRLPLLVKAGFRGPIYTQRACRDLCRIMLRDSAFLQEKDAEWENRKRERKGLAPVSPLYNQTDAAACLTCFKGLAYGHRTRVAPGISVRLQDAGHILGSSIIEVWLEDEGQHCKLVFSGDLGHAGAPILRDPTVVSDADVVLMESTYGNRLHRSRSATLAELQTVLTEATKGKGNILIPAFAVGRTQELLYLFGQHFQEWDLQRWWMFLDSPLAIEATAVYLKHSDLYDAEAVQWLRQNRRHPFLPNLQFSRTTQQSMAINRIRSGAFIIAGSGMCTGGRIRHHLKHNVWRSDCHIVIAGFQARGTLGRQLVDGASRIRLWGETIQVKAKVHTIGGFSAHADQQELSDWYGGFDGQPPVLLVHGEAEAAAVLQRHLHTTHQAPVRVARPGEQIDLAQLTTSGRF